jgi:(1->4)-alpha-D-glucan 1-alpha-D-glucosylmutase
MRPTPQRRRVPLATYRFQLRAEFGFAAAAAQADYLARLGVSHAYTSPSLQAAEGSSHGYDGVDPTRASQDLGGEEARRGLSAALQRNDLGQVVDIVPNHLSIADPRNTWWWDVLRNGPASRYAEHFDVDWSSPDPELTGKVVVPVLGKPLADELAAGSIRLTDHGGERVIEYYDNRFPVAPGSEDRGALADVLARQHYLLTFWRDGLTKLTHRRFFDVTTLVGVRVEDDAVFDDVHREVLSWFARGEIDGLRVDHPDGLADPTGYMQRLAAAAPDAWLVVEKILEPGEDLRADWPVDGTTGYDALNSIADVFVDASGEAALTAAYETCVGSHESFEDVARRSRVEVVHGMLTPELDRVTTALGALVDAPWDDLRRVVGAFVAELPVYRTYVQPGTPVSAADRDAVAVAVERVGRHHPEADRELTSRLASVVLDLGPDPSAGREVTDFVRRLQQLSGPAMAKGVEDTTFYRYTRFVAANEVGGDPQHLGGSVGDFHAANELRARQWPTTMVSTSTHDTKRSEDVRARLAVLSEMGDEWTRVLTRWCARTAEWWRESWGSVPRDPSMDVLLHQTLVGAHPLPEGRAHTYLEKAMREAKNVTSWIDPDEKFEDAAHGLLDRMLTDEVHRGELAAVVDSVLVHGRVNAAAQKLLALTVPGVPDIYQGTELWSLDLVDPDNRRPVDYPLRRRLLDELDRCDLAAALGDAQDPGSPKLLVVHRALELRRRRRASFIGGGGTYTRLSVRGDASDHAIAFQRGDELDAVITVVPRFPLRLARDGGWRDTTVELGRVPWRDVLTGSEHAGGPTPVGELTAGFPVALLERA